MIPDIPYSQKETPGLNKNLAKIWPNLHVNWMQLNLQLVEFVNLVRAFLSGCRVHVGLVNLDEGCAF